MEQKYGHNPVFYHNGEDDMIGPEGWYHYDETWSDAYGPYESKEEAVKALVEYAKSL